MNVIVPFTSLRCRVICTFLWLLSFYPVFAQGPQRIAQPRTIISARDIFTRVQHGFSTAAVADFSAFLASPVFVNLRGAESGYYSGNQARYILESYLRLHRLATFVFTTVDDSGSNPYATGSVALSFRGNRERAQVYVALSLEGDRWMITQINIY